MQSSQNQSGQNQNCGQTASSDNLSSPGAAKSRNTESSSDSEEKLCDVGNSNNEGKWIERDSCSRGFQLYIMYF